MRILFINSVSSYGSTGRIVNSLAKYEEKKGNSVLIAYARGKHLSNTPSYKIGNFFSIYFHVLMTRIFDAHGLFSKIATRKLLKKIEQFQPNLIHLNNIHGYYLSYPILFKYLSLHSIPVVWTLHDSWAFTGHCAAFYDYIKCNKWKSGCFECPLKREYPSSFGFDRSKRNYAQKQGLFLNVSNMTIVTPSKWLLDQVKSSFFRNKTVFQIHNSVNLSRFVQKEKSSVTFGVEEDKKIILGVANVWTKWKGLNEFYQLSKKVDSETRIILVGLSSRQIRKLPHNIIGFERTNSPEDLALLYSSATLFFNPTYSDNFPTTNLEARACNCPIVAYDVGGVRETLVGAKSLVLNPFDNERLEKVLSYLDECSQKRSLSSPNALPIVDSSEQKYHDLFVSLVNK